METFESIDREAKLYSQQRRDELMARTGGWVTGAVDGTWIEDRSTGVVLLRTETQHKAGDVTQLFPRIRGEGAGCTPIVIHFRILRAVTIEEVRALAAKYGGATPLPVRAGNWYQVLTD